MKSETMLEMAGKIAKIHDDFMNGDLMVNN